MSNTTSQTKKEEHEEDVMNAIEQGDNILPHLKEWEKVTIYEDAVDSLRGAILMYGVAAARSLVRDGLMPLSRKEDCEKLVTLPLSLVDFHELVMCNVEKMREAFVRNGKDASSFNLFADCILSIHQHQGELDDAYLLEFDDEHANEELVYGIAVDKTLKRIEVAFRGSTTAKDWRIDAQYGLASLDDRDDDQGVWIHQGFKEYLYGRSKQYRRMNASRKEEESDNKQQRQQQQCKLEIITKKILDVLDEYPGYDIFTYGHSLGGALCTLFAFELAANQDPRLVKPISCVSFASPKVGNRGFALAFEKLERNGMVRCLRVSNHLDIVPQLPRSGTLAPCLSCCFRHVLAYRHVGMHLTLRRSGNHDLRYSHVYKKKRMQLFFMESYDSMCNAADGMTDMTRRMMRCDSSSGSGRLVVNHSCVEYLNRLGSNETLLKAETLHELYRRHHKTFASAAQAHNL